jgi:lysozyme family protein
MAASSYDAALARVLAHEGGYVDHPSDPGGPTNHGITRAEYASFKGRSVSAAEVRAMPLADAKAIYRAEYWAKMRCDLLPPGLDYALFDYGVNSGTGRAPKILQRLCGLPANGKMTDAVNAAVRQRSAADLINRLCDERLAFLRRLKTWPVFGKGWQQRVAEVRTAALRMAADTDRSARLPAVAPRVTPTIGKAIVPPNTGMRTATTGLIVAAGGAVAQQAHQSGASGTLIIGLLAAALCAAVLTWFAWQRRQVRREDAPVMSVSIPQMPAAKE